LCIEEKIKKFYNISGGINERLERYGNILHDGDFEYWQPCCYMDKNSDEWKQKKKEADSLKFESKLNINSIRYKAEELRTMWIKSRFFEYQSSEWLDWEHEFVKLYEEIRDPKRYGTIVDWKW